MQRTDSDFLTIVQPQDFSWKECFIFLGRNDQELLHTLEGEFFFKLIKIENELILLKISNDQNELKIDFPHTKPSEHSLEAITAYVSDLFDLNRGLTRFYEMASNDPVLQHIANKSRGLRILGIPDLFEALTWAIMGQQINLTFAYTLKRRFVEQYGEKLDHEGRTFWVYPEPANIASLEVEDLRKLQFTARKAEYVIAVAKAMSSGKLSKEKLQLLKEPSKQREALIQLKGVGAWTADYVMMKCLLEPAAFPIADVGLHNAIKTQLKLEKKPSVDEIMKIAKNWNGWEAYATFYLWRSLYE